jgi:hypothetical protein
MTNQEIFDKAVSGIIAQGGPSTRIMPGDNVVCCYRTETGRKCAIGQLIADEFYHKEMEGRNASASLVIGAITRSIGSISGVPQRVFMSALQGIHDALTLSTSTDEEFLVSFKEKAYDFAKKWELSPNVLEMD